MKFVPNQWFFKFAVIVFFHTILEMALGSARFTHKVEPIKDGARLTANFSHDNTGNKVTVTLFTEVTDQKGDRHLIHLAELDHQHPHSGKSVTRTWDIEYNKINAELAKKAPNANLVVGPGTKMWVLGRWIFHSGKSDPYDGSMLGKNHYYGGTGKSGGFTLPTPSNGWTGPKVKSPSSGGSAGAYYEGGVVSSLDVLNPVEKDITGTYPAMKGAGLGSRYERELKLHVDLADHARVAKELEALVHDPGKVESLFGKGAKMKEDNTYVGKPMVDEYRDTATFDGASNGTALRFRTGKGVTKLNFKPNDGTYRGNGVFDRVEYEGEKITSPSAITGFADSSHPANFLSLLNRIAPRGSHPSDFFAPAMKITDERRKFKISLPSGEEVEISLDKFKARQMSGNRMTGPEVEVAQLEAEIDHMGAQGSTNVTSNTGSQKWSDQFDTLKGTKLDTFLKNLGAGSAIGDSPSSSYQFHGEKDFATSSPIQQRNNSTFTKTSQLFTTLRNHLFPNGVGASGQKYAVAAAAAGLVAPRDWAPSVKTMIEEHLGRKPKSAAESKKCLLSMVKIGGTS